MSTKFDLVAVKALIEPIVTAQQLELYDLEFLTEYGRKILRIYINKEGVPGFSSGVTLDDCEKVTRSLESVLDAHDPIPHAYVLEVSSPGIERKLIKDSHYQCHIGKSVEVKLNRPVFDAIDEKNRKKFRGVLVGLEGEVVVISSSTGEKLRLPREHLAYCRLVCTEEELWTTERS